MLHRSLPPSLQLHRSLSFHENPLSQPSREPENPFSKPSRELPSLTLSKTRATPFPSPLESPFLNLSLEFLSKTLKYSSASKGILVFCSPLPSDPEIKVVVGIDLNHGDIVGYIPEELGMLTDLALFHSNSNRFCGTVPRRFDRLKLLFELDISNNRFAGRFPTVVLKLPSLKFLDIRFNEFEGGVPSSLFDKPLDAIFINHNIGNGLYFSLYIVVQIQTLIVPLEVNQMLK